MPGNIFNLDDDFRAFLLRMTASAERWDNAVGEAQLLARNLNRLAAKLEQEVDAIQRARKAAGGE